MKQKRKDERDKKEYKQQAEMIWEGVDGEAGWPRPAAWRKETEDEGRAEKGQGSRQEQNLLMWRTTWSAGLISHLKMYGNGKT